MKALKQKTKTGEEQDGYKPTAGTCSDDGEYVPPECVPKMVPVYMMCDKPLTLEIQDPKNCEPMP